MEMMVRYSASTRFQTFLLPSEVKHPFFLYGATPLCLFLTLVFLIFIFIFIRFYFFTPRFFFVFSACNHEPFGVVLVAAASALAFKSHRHFVPTHKHRHTPIILPADHHVFCKILFLLWFQYSTTQPDARFFFLCKNNRDHNFFCHLLLDTSCCIILNTFFY